jgi:ketosteroid isomerase-like protein
MPCDHAISILADPSSPPRSSPSARASAVVGLDSLVDQQWSHIWNCTHGFAFQFEELHSHIQGDLAWAALPWQSHGIAQDGSQFLRTGRATYILQRRDGPWLAVHSHHSLNPSPEKLAKAIL